ncbi:MAG TPA: N-acetylmuramoyl-L-alanine amidase [Nitrospirota bacterium]|nr:N-acetylmuramoyl-L-alanine amidase [Nitrospirota bacterium]
MKLILVSLLMMPASTFSAEKGLTVKGVRYFSYAAFTRIVFEIEAAAPYILTRTTDGRTLLFSAYEGPFALKAQLPVIRDGVVNGIETKEDAGRNVVLIHLDSAGGEVKDFVLRGPDRIVLDIARGAASSAASPSAPPPSSPTAIADTAAVVVVLDAGHGGRDTGIMTIQGQEKSLTLDLAHAVRKILQKSSHFKVLLTREKDQALSLDERAGFANAAGTTVFVSIHAATGAAGRVFILDPDDDLAGQQAARTASRDFLSFEAGSEEQEKLWGRQQAVHAKESGVFGRRLARQLEGRDDAEPVQAPIAGLKAIDSAAVMVEIGLEQDRAKAAEAIAKGIEKYVRENR